ncbi:hypothetical protein [Nostoc punctiforme]|nr:hypothetical protein [Nostoc punctiforme]
MNFFNEPPTLREASANAQRLQELNANGAERRKKFFTELYCTIGDRNHF